VHVRRRRHVPAAVRGLAGHVRLFPPEAERAGAGRRGGLGGRAVRRAGGAVRRGDRPRLRRLQRHGHPQRPTRTSAARAASTRGSTSAT
jgi:hypothetical protein